MANPIPLNHSVLCCARQFDLSDQTWIGPCNALKKHNVINSFTNVRRINRFSNSNKWKSKQNYFSSVSPT